MAAPKRRAEWNTEASVLEDLRLARDAGGIDRAGADRLAGSLRLRHGSNGASPDQLVATRTWLKQHVGNGAAAYRVMHQGDAVALAAAESAESILLREANDRRTAASLRKTAVEHHQCFIAVDSLRKREFAVLTVMAKSAFAAVEPKGELFVTVDGMLRLLRPFAELAALNVDDAAKKFSQRAALQDDQILVRAVEHAIWAVANFGALPVYGLDRLRAFGITSFADQSIEYLLDGIIKVPFVAQPDDIMQLATATQLGEDARTFYGRLLATPVMAPVVQRFIIWLASHDPRSCHYYNNDVMVGYCAPHYYVALCESFVSIQDDSYDRFRDEMLEAVTALGVSLHLRRRGRPSP
jgi:hypothetical protein